MLGLAVLAVLVSQPAGAGAATTCVGIESAGCEAETKTIQAALDEALATPAGDRIVVGPGRFEGPFSYAGGSGGGIEVVGQGPTTVLTAPPGTVPMTVLSLGNDAQYPSVVSNLTVHIPANSNDSADTGILAGTVSNVRVASDSFESSTAAPVGILLAPGGEGLRNTVVELVGGGELGTGVEAAGGPSAPAVTISDSRITGPRGVIAAGRATNLVRTRVLGNVDGVFACNAPVVVEDSVVRVTGKGIGLLARGGNECGTGQASVIARQVTIVGTGAGGGQVGAEAAVGVASQTPAIEVSLSVLRNLGTAFRAVGAPGASATILVGASDFEAARHLEVPEGGTADFAQIQPNIDADPLFTAELFSDFNLRAGSPAIDSAFSPPLGVGESATDLAGDPRVTDGDGDGVAARDMGAYEADAAPDTRPPETTLSRLKRKLKSRQKGVLFAARFESSEAGSTFECRLDAGRFAPCSSPFQKRLSFGHHRFEVRAVDAAGNADPTPARGAIAVLRQQRKHHPAHPARAGA